MKSADLYCDEILSGHTPVEKVGETEDVLAFYHMRPHWPVRIVVIPKRHISSLLTLAPTDNDRVLEMLMVIRETAVQMFIDRGACHIVTNSGEYQDSKPLHWHFGSGRPVK